MVNSSTAGSVPPSPSANLVSSASETVVEKIVNKKHNIILYVGISLILLSMLCWIFKKTYEKNKKTEGKNLIKKEKSSPTVTRREFAKDTCGTSDYLFVSMDGCGFCEKQKADPATIEALKSGALKTIVAAEARKLDPENAVYQAVKEMNGFPAFLECSTGNVKYGYREFGNISKP